MSTQGLDRRSFIRAAAGGAVLLPGLLAACGPAAPAAPAAVANTKPAGGAATGAPPAAGGARAANVWPTYIPLQGGPKPDYASAGQQYEDGWDTYPSPPTKAWLKDPPGAGGTVSVFSNAYNPPSTPLDGNQAWQVVNRQLNATVNFTVTAPGDYPAKLGTVMAGDDLPDIILCPGGLNVTIAQAGTANLPQFLQTKCADLTPYLSGDAAKEYPYLAAIPTFAWKNSGSAFSGHLYMLPLQRYVAGRTFFKNSTFYDSEIGKDYVPKDAADLKRVFQTLHRPQEDRYATASYQGQAMFIETYSAMFGAPNNWALDADGKLVKNYETAEFKQAVDYVRDLWASGLFHPKTLNYADINAARLDLVAGKFALYVEGFGQPWQDFWRRGLRNSPPYNFLPLAPFPAVAGGKAQHFLGPGFIATNALKKASPERIKELLRIMDFLASPFGTQEDLLLQYGLRDVHYTLDGAGKLALNDRSNVDANYVNWKYVMQHPQVMYVPDIPGFAQAEYDAEHFLISAGVADPTLGLFSPMLGQKGATINRTVVDGLTDIIAGRRPMTDFDALIRDWRTNGGEAIRKELMDALAANV
ncbi:MAG: extracellular solute-binding protein [Chloroflexota bacterium]